MPRDPDLATRLASWIPGLAFAPAPRTPTTPPLRPRAHARVTIEHASPIAGPRRAGTALPIIALAPDWEGLPSPAHHVLREFARDRRVLWLNSLATRAPRPALPRGALARRRLRDLAAGATHVEHDLWVATPAVMPGRAGPLRRQLDHALVRATIGVLRRQLGIGAFELWTFLPTTGDLVGRLGEARAVYYCVDEWSLFGHLERAAIAAAERHQLARVQVVFAVDHALAERKRHLQPATFVAPHGVDHALFARALDDATPVPPDIAAVPGPRIGCIGAVREWVDVALLRELARLRPSWTLVLIGPVLADVTALRGVPNVHLLGPRPHAALPGYCKALDAGLIPYRAEPRITYASPLALREFLAAGVPVVSTDVPEVRRYAEGSRPLCRVATTPAQIAQALDSALAETGPVARGARSAAMKHETWTARTHDLRHTLDLPPPRTHP